MNNASCANRLAEGLGARQNARYFANYIGVRTTRTHLLAIGRHIDLSTLAEQTGFRVRVFFRREVFDRLTENLPQFGGNGSDLYDAMLALHQAMTRAPLRDCPVLFQVGELTLVAQPGPTDHDDPRYALTVSLAPSDEA